MTGAISRMDDAELVGRALTGDQTAVGEIYDRYADSIYSFCRSRLRNDADAADAMQDTFVRAATKLEQLKDRTKLRSWLYAIARNQIIATGRQSRRLAGDDDMELIVSNDEDPDIDLLRVESANQLWDAADGLSERDHEVLELHLRHGLVGRSLADALGVTESHANVLLSRMRDRIATSLGSLLVAREGRDNCYELDLLLGGWDGRFSLETRSRVTRHIKACDICEQTHTRVLAGGVSFGVLPIIPAPSGLRVGTIGKMADSLGIHGAGAGTSAAGQGSGSIRFADAVVATSGIDRDGWEWRADGFPGQVGAASRRGIMLLSAAAIFIVLVALGGVTAIVFNDSADLETAAAVEVLGAVETSEPPTTVSALPAPVPSPTSEGASTSTTETVEEETTTTELEELTTTEPPTTLPPTTEAPTTQTPTTAPPTTQAPTTQAPTTQAPTTQAPTTQAPTTQAPTTQAPTTQAPTTEAPVTSPPTEPPPPTDPPVDPPPPTDPPVDPPPPTDPPVDPPPPTDPPPPPNEPPVFQRAAASPSLVEVAKGARCIGGTVTVIAAVTDADGTVESVVVTWRPGNGQTETTTLQPAAGAGPGTFTGTIGPWFDDGRQTSSVTATDDDGDSTTTRVTVSVSPCPPG